MKKIAKKKPMAAEEVAKIADQGGDVSRFFTNKGKMVSPVQRVNVDFTKEMLDELDMTADRLNVSRQAVIKIFLRQALDQHYVAQKAKKTG